MIARRAAPLAVVSAALTMFAGLAGCTSSSAPPGRPVAAAPVAARVRTALDALTSAHLDIDTSGLGGGGTADVQLAHGSAVAVNAHTALTGPSFEQVTIGSTSYAKLPTSLNSSGKPWVLVSGTSSNATARAIADHVSIAGVLSNVGVVATLLAEPKTLSDEGTQTVSGVRTTHYGLQLDPTRSTGNAELDSLLHMIGTAPVPAEVWLDARHLPVELVIDVSVAGAGFPVTVLASRFDAPLHITAPPADQVSTG